MIRHTKRIVKAPLSVGAWIVIFCMAILFFGCDQAEAKAWKAPCRAPTDYPAGWDKLIMKETHNRNLATGNGYYGYLQFDRTSWIAVRHCVPGALQYARADHAPRDTQIAVARYLLAYSGAKAWPVSSDKLGVSRTNHGVPYTPKAESASQSWTPEPLTVYSFKQHRPPSSLTKLLVGDGAHWEIRSREGNKWTCRRYCYWMMLKRPK